MSLEDNIDNVAYTSALDNDKILETYSGSFPVSASSSPPFFGNIAKATVINSFGGGGFPVMIYSINNEDWFDAGMAIYDASSPISTKKFAATCTPTSTGISVIGQNFTGSAITCYYKIILLAE